MPGSGDSVQALKAGIMEIPDVIAVNKMDHPAAKTMLNEVRSIVALPRSRDRRPRVLLTEALHAENVPELWHRDRGAPGRPRAAAGGSRSAAGGISHRRGVRHRVEPARAPIFGLRLPRIQRCARSSPRVEERELDPLSAVREILERASDVPCPRRSLTSRLRASARGVAREDAALPDGDLLDGSPAATSTRKPRTSSGRGPSRSAARSTRSRRSAAAERARRRRRRERREPRSGRRLGGARGGDSGDDLHAAGRADGEGSRPPPP